MDSVVTVTAAVVLSVPLTAPVAGHTGDTPETHNRVRSVCRSHAAGVRFLSLEASYGVFGFFLTVAAQL